MAGVYDSWDRLVRATLRREQLRLIAERTPSEHSSSSSPNSPNFIVDSGRFSPANFPVLSFGKAFEYEEILKATNYFSKSNLIKQGRSGDLFSGVLVLEETVVIKRIDLSSAEKELYYISELKVLDKLSDRRLVPFLGHCHCLENTNEKCLVYKCMPNSDLSSSFYSKIIYLESIFPGSNWGNRLSIATRLAEALSYLHHECVPPLVHRDIKASSILLDDQFEVRLCSLGDAYTLERKHNQTRHTRFLDLPEGSHQGPSEAGTSNATCAYDVHCFGKVLLELVTGKLGAATDSSIMMNLMIGYLPKTVLGQKDPIESVIDPTAISDMHGMEEKVWAMALIAKACLDLEPSKRPTMKNVVMALKYPSKVKMIMASGSLDLADPPGLNSAGVPKTTPKRSKLHYNLYKIIRNKLIKL